MSCDFRQIGWDDACRDACRDLALLAIREDLGRQHDWTTLALVPSDAEGRAVVVSREAGIIAGLPAAELFLRECDPHLTFTSLLEEGAEAEPGRQVARIEGSARSLLTSERTMLNFLGRLSGVATLTRKYVRAVAGAKARIYDTRKTTPGWRMLEKYAVRCGGGCNHRQGLYDAVLIKDNHLSGAARQRLGGSIFDMLNRLASAEVKPAFVEVEAESPAEVEELLKVMGIDTILLDNFSLDELRQAVQLRNDHGLRGKLLLEASGGITLKNAHDVARTGVDRLSIGAITHSAPAIDLSMERT